MCLCYTLMQMVIAISQALTRMVLTIFLMTENLLRMLLQAIYNFLSFTLQLLSLLPICLIFLLTTQMSSCLCNGNSCGAYRGHCNCLVSVIVLALIYYFLIRKSEMKLEDIEYERVVDLETPGNTTEDTVSTDTTVAVSTISSDRKPSYMYWKMKLEDNKTDENRTEPTKSNVYYLL